MRTAVTMWEYIRMEHSDSSMARLIRQLAKHPVITLLIGSPNTASEWKMIIWNQILHDVTMWMSKISIHCSVMRPRKEIEEQSFEPPQATRKLEHTYLEGTQIRWFILTKRRSYTIPGLTPKTNGRPGEIAVRSDSGCRHGYPESMLGMSEISCSAS